MPIQSRWSTPTPRISLPTWVFGEKETPQDNEEAIFVDAENPKNTLTFAEYQLYSKRVALGLRHLGVKRGDRVLTFSENGIFVPCLFFGVVMAGAIFTGAAPSSTALELTYQLQDSEATVLIASTNLINVAIEAARNVGLPSHHLFHIHSLDTEEYTTSRNDIRSWTEILASAHDAQDFTWHEPADPETAICCLNYSSGTTGRPKGVQVTHYSYVANGEAHLLLHRLQEEALNEPYSGRALCFLPLNHVAAQTTFIANCPKMGVQTYIMSRYSFDGMLRHVKDFQITELMTAPTIISSLVANSRLIGDSLDSVRYVICGTAPLPPSLAERGSNLFKDPRVMIRQGWGMTELTCMGTMNDPRLVASPVSVGEAAPNSTVKLMGGEKEITEVHQRGELWFSSPTLMAGYWRNPEATSETIVEQDGMRWLKTGDIAYFDSWGPGANIYIVDRSKEILKVKGYQVAPAELEAILATHPDIIDSGVIGVDTNGYEAPRAYIVKRPGATVTSENIMSWMNNRVAPYKRLHGGVFFVDAIPRTQSGKILRRLLRATSTVETQWSTPLKAKLA
ncbi:4-coumarate ligase [Fusarium beomiforme]|uniref:4-coumarate ligase n=1 Tax=Fusarium beomiforme TaxID=44412 RepID=A0A9P5ASK6_9HYPO|nr:4-coumarate ligase [Fusarium beomiforme]